jgi:hypothetical protein
MDRLRITVGGRLMCERWDSDAREFFDVDVTDRIEYFLYDECGLEKGVRLWDIFNMVRDAGKYEFLSPILTNGPWLEQIIEEGLYPTQKCVDKVVLDWQGSITDFGGYPEIGIWGHFYGNKEGDDNRWSLSMSPTNEFTDCEVVLNPKFILYDETNKANKSRNEEERNKSYYLPLVEVSKEFTLMDILKGIFWDLSFHGGPYERQKQAEELEEISKDIKDGKAELISFDDVKALMKDLDDEG